MVGTWDAVVACVKVGKSGEAFIGVLADCTEASSGW